MTLVITPEDIQSEAQLMGKDFSDTERVAILQTMESCDVQACPGSGKTTTMVAKLHILAGKIRGTNQGICALSHTNAARHEIETSLGSANISLCRYPHFIGTIQSFVDTFLAIPAYVMQFGHRPVMIDDEGYEFIAGRYYSQLPYGTRVFIERSRSRGAQNNTLRRQFAEGYFAKLSYRFDNISNFIYYENNQEQEFEAGPTTPSYQDVMRVKSTITQDGYITYHDAFALANWYLNKFPHLCSALALRFPFVFVDEMQDTDRYQITLMEKIFTGRSSFQKFGDPNQSIYNHLSDEFTRVWSPRPDFQITSSKRLSCSIARLSQTLGVLPQAIQGNASWADHNHTILCFTPPQAHQIIPAFAKIIEQEGLQNGLFMALGAVAKPNEQQLTIPNYWPNFERRLSRLASTSTFWEDLAISRIALLQNKDLGVARTSLINGVSKLLRLQDARTSARRSYSAGAFETEVNKKGPAQTLALNHIILGWSRILFQNSTISADQLIADLQTIFSLINIQLSQRTISYLRQGPDASTRVLTVVQDPNSMANLYRHSSSIVVNVNTIHSAKGQTHQATLLLETFYHKYDLFQIKSYLWGEPVRNPGVRIQQRFLPLAYVACTRPSHLLCLAMQGDHLTSEERTKLTAFGWRIIDL